MAKAVITLKVTPVTLRYIGRIAQYGQTLGISEPDKLFEMWYREALQSVILKVANAITRISQRATFHFTASEALAFRYTGESFIKEHRDTEAAELFLTMYPEQRAKLVTYA